MFGLRYTLKGNKTLWHFSRHQATMSLPKFPVDRIPIPSQMNIQLTDAEDQICILLDNYVTDAQENSKNSSLRTVCRIAGGWPRDKVRYLAKMHPQLSEFCHNSYLALKATISTSHSIM